MKSSPFIPFARNLFSKYNNNFMMNHVNQNFVPSCVTIRSTFNFMRSCVGMTDDNKSH